MTIKSHTLLTQGFWVDAGERAAKTVAQSLLALYGTTSVLGITDVSPLNSLDVAGLAALLSVLTSIVSTRVGGNDSASLVNDR